MAKHTIKALNALVEVGRAEAGEFEAPLRAAYLTVLEQAERDAAERLGTITAGAADWSLPDIDELYDRLAAIAAAQSSTQGIRETVVEATMSGILASYGITFDLRNPLVAHLIEQQGQHIVGIVDTQRAQIMEVLKGVWEAGGGIKEAQEAVLSTGIERTVVQAEAIARTELVGSQNGGSLAAVHLTGAAEYKKWLTAPGAPNPRHATYEGLNGQVKPIAGMFNVGGYPCQYPGDPSLPAGEVINCRCSVAYTDDPTGLSAALTVLNFTAHEVGSYQEDGMSGILTSDTGSAGHTTGMTLGGRESAPEEAVLAAAAAPDWTSPALAQYDTLTRDARMIQADSLQWRTPIPLMLQDGDIHGPGSVPPSQYAGRITSISVDGKNLPAEGTFDATEAGERAREIVSQGNGAVSIDVAVQEYDYLLNMEGFDMWWDRPLPTDQPPGVQEGAAMEEVKAARAEDGEEVPEGWVRIPVNLEDEVMCITRGEIMGATLVPFAAFRDAHLEVTAVTADGGPAMIRIYAPIHLVKPLTASAVGLAPLKPPSSWFEDPMLQDPTPLTVTPEGEVYGHIAAWGTCHTGHPGRCVTPPPGVDGYSLFHLGEIESEEGDRFPVGTITLGGGHANLSLGVDETRAHYDDAGTAIADVRCGDDGNGIWVHGAVRPGASADDVRALMAAKPSGDWRPINGKLQLVAILAVNVPGFPVARARVASGAIIALVAAGQFSVLPPGSMEHRQKALHALAVGGRNALHALAAGE